MEWRVILTSGTTAVAVSTVVSGVVSYIVGRRLQLKQHQYERREEERRRAEGEEAWQRSIRLSRTQEVLLRFCRENPSERYSLQLSGGTYWLTSCEKDKKTELPDLTIQNQLADMESKGYLRTLLHNGGWHVFELTEQGKTLEVPQRRKTTGDV